MKILKTVKKVPGGLMVVPLLLGALFNTICPQALEVGGFTTALFKTGAMSILGLFCLCNGAQINIKQAGKPLIKGITLTATKFIIGAVLGIIVSKFIGPEGILGITPLAIVATMTNSNGGLFAALAGEYGDSTDVGAISILSLNDGPFFTMLAFGITGLANVPIVALFAAVIPILIGFILGNLDEDIREFLAPGATLLIPFFAFPLGAALNFNQIITAGVPGIILGIAVTLITGIGGYFAMKAIKSEHPAVGAAVGTTAGNAAGTPEAIAVIDPTLVAVAAVSTVQVAAAIIVTAILCPMLVSYLDKREKKRKSALNVN